MGGVTTCRERISQALALCAGSFVKQKTEEQVSPRFRSRERFDTPESAMFDAAKRLCKTPCKSVLSEEDPRLLDHDWLCESIYRNRYGEDRLQRRISLRKKQGTPLWGVDPKQKRPARKRGAS
jgi:hypothetical protein